MLPISLVSAINPVAGAAMSGLNTAGKTSRDAIESGNGIGDALAYGLVAGSVDFALNALSSTAFQARGAKGASWGEKFISRVAKTEGGDLALRTIAGTLVDTGADTFSLLVQHNIKKMYDPNYKETLSEEEVLKTIAVSLVVNGGMRLGTNMSKGVYETDADGMLKPLDEARMMGQMPKGADEPKIMDMEGDESDGLSGVFRDMEAEKPGIDTKGLEIEAEPSSVKVSEGGIIEQKGSGETVIYRRVQGGEGTRTSQQRVTFDADGRIHINKKNKNLNISVDNGEHSQNFINNNRPGADIYEWEVPKWFDDMMQEYSIPQADYRTNSLNQSRMAPKLTDPSPNKIGRTLEIPSPWLEWMEEYATNGRIIRGDFK